MKKVLVISPHFPPINAPDHQRIRMMLPYMSALGWHVEVVMIDASCVEGKIDSLLEKTIPSTCKVHAVKTMPLKYGRLLGMRTLGWRSLYPIQRAVDALLEKQSFDMIFFSTTIFQVLAWGPRWLKKFNVPYIIDLQDPWLKTYQYQKTPPGGWIKHQIAQTFAFLQEPVVMKHASHIMSVSDEYPRILTRRYPFLSNQKFSVIPFGAGDNDIELLKIFNIQQSVFNVDDGKRHWVYLGRGGDDMAFSLNILFKAIEQDRLKNPQDWENIQLHFIGTSYAQKDQARQTILPIAKKYCLEDIVQEQTTRIPYFEGLQLLQDSDVVMTIGSDDHSYSPSKVFSCLLAGRPMIALLHEHSLVVPIVERFQPGSVVKFSCEKKMEDLIKETDDVIQILKIKQKTKQMSIDKSFLDEYGARTMTKKICDIFNQTLEKTC